MSSRARFFVGAAVLVAALGVTARLGLELRGPHVVLSYGSPLNAEKQRELDEAIAAKHPRTKTEVLDFALDYTARSLRFSLDHPTSLRFESATRDGNCVEYTYLFVQAFNAAAKRASVSARAYAVRSTQARIAGVKVPLRGFADHDFAVVQDDAERLYVDPTLYDAHLGWNVAFNVKDKDRLAVR